MIYFLPIFAIKGSNQDSGASKWFHLSSLKVSLLLDHVQTHFMTKFLLSFYVDTIFRLLIGEVSWGNHSFA